jgi:hypothetical protein
MWQVGVEESGVQSFLVGRLDGKRPLGKPRRRFEKNLQEMGRGCGDWMVLSQDRVIWRGTCEYGNEHSGSIKCGKLLD